MSLFTTKYPSSTIASTYAGLPEDQDYYLCNHWITYHSRNKDLQGLAIANEIVLTDIDNLYMFADFESCNYDCNFIQYFINNGLDFRDFLGNVYCTVTNVSNALYNVSDRISKPNKFLPYAIAGVGILFLFKDEIKKLAK